MEFLKAFMKFSVAASIIFGLLLILIGTLILLFPQVFLNVLIYGIGVLMIGSGLFLVGGLLCGLLGVSYQRHDHDTGDGADHD